MIRACDFSYQHPTRDAPAFEHVSIEIPAGQRVLLCGDSGSGKSTFATALAGVLEEDALTSGSLEVAGTVGLVLQDPDPICSRIGDDVAFGCENLGQHNIWEKVRWALKAVGLDLPLDHPTARLSGGQRQRLALAGVLAMGADVVVLDEPTANLDPQGAQEIVRLVDEVVANTGATLLVIEHRAQRWLPYVERIVEMTGQGIVERTELPEPPRLPGARGVDKHQQPAVWTRQLRTHTGPPRDVELPEGAATVITGPNGAGKTSLAMVLAGLDAPRSGEVDYAPQVRDGLGGPAHRWRSAQLARRIGCVFQDPEHQFVARTVAEEMAVGPRVMGMPDAPIDQLLEQLRLDHLRNANPFTLSGGEKRRLSVATALVAAPRVLILDEPTFGQDEQTFVELVTLLRQLTDRGVTVAAITHDELFLHALGDHHVEVTP
ncbi:ABC transporter ATP-binding protein [Corynebacterium uberis]|uniref:ABC transporter ATP-binding protein n=1 Tax=Corynebacterium TaxID=1716 RepID=UPI001D09F683|nr:ABC transporter ATP-binding protein [Corynebacterium uberis]MCZ9308924.1 energy-coupling factor ABC transporter ATP-binding protein [Corynebacterium sp. c6VSa_13]UDL74603.1 energy-coupling factor ABC transporter ATP-binding protein [Corynebacterium uberis]UDL76563.1 energy-coupling factor ABC transporter ATP-binding protein [Corynebacterium uberis]UDL78776.1 energy-coupling factor ABC transporter ATP-binding protein [Corynebacterium uberis]UDL81054.1 energy-coupling factor ABC transporter A